ncbi:MAG: cobalamin-independent methionine synthase II family protein [Dehalococcoidia bacterium]|nr:cobalamin-independent methionine synthase II family protein [Dehalococcoidia bacterium]
MKASDSRILTTHTGSLPRPEELVAMLADVARGEPVDEANLNEAAREATTTVVAAQLDAGVDVINNGEQSRVSFSTYVTQRMSGFGGAWTRRGHRDQNEFPSVARARVVQLMRDVPTCIGPLSYERLDLVERECRQLLEAVDAAGSRPEDLFMTAASPGIVALTLANRYYDSHEDYVFTLAEELRKEYEIIIANGLTLQLDCPDLAMERHVSYQDEPLSSFRDLVALHIGAINHALTNIPRDQVRLHVCWGNSEGPHIYDVPLEDILDLIYEANVGALVMEMANPRHGHEHRVYHDRPLPDGMLLVAGVIDTKTNYVEHPRLVADRLHQAVAAAGGDPTRVLAGTDCGFDTSAGSNRVDAGVVWLKLRAMRQGADIASSELS